MDSDLADVELKYVENAPTGIPDSSSNDSNSTKGEPLNVQQNSEMDSKAGKAGLKGSIVVVEPEVESLNESETGPVVPPQRAMWETGPPPDGGYGWVLVACLFVIHMIVFGPQYAFGVYTRYYVDSNMFPGASLTMLAFVGSVASAGCPLFGPISGRAADLYGGRYVTLFGASVLLLAFICASFSTQLWQLFLTQGVLYGIGQSFAYFPYMGTVPAFFDKRRGLAIGLGVAGTGVGGLCFGPLTQTMIDSLGIGWALRITGIIQFVCVTICALLYRSRYKPLRRKSVVAANAGKPGSSMLFDFSFFKNKQFSKMWAAQFIGFFGFFYPFFFASVYASSVGLSQEQGAIIVGLTSAGSTIGRVLVGTASDRLGHFNSYSVCIFFGGLSMMLIWPFCKTYASLIIFGIIYSFFSGGFISLQPTCLAQIIGLSAMSSAIGLLFFGGAFSNLAGPPLGGVLIQTSYDAEGNKVQNFLGLQLFGGAMMMIAWMFITWVRMERANWKIFAKV